MVNDATSSWQVLTSGVPQGLELGPVLFKIIQIFFNNLDEDRGHPQ